MNFKIRVIAGVLVRSPVWIGMILLNLVLMFIGFVLCAIAPAQPFTGLDDVRRMHWRWELMWLWDNDEDGIDGCPILPDLTLKNPDWIGSTFGWSTRRRWWVWSAWRNSVNNLRFTRIGRSPDYGVIPAKNTLAFLTSGVKFWLCVPLTHTTPWRELRLGWTTDADGGFKSTISSLA